MTMASALGAIVIITYLEHYFGEAKRHLVLCEQISTSFP
jgi:hypothetical protein